MSAAGRTYRQKRSGRLGWFHALLNRELEHRNTKADLAVLRLRFENECLEHSMAKGDIGRLQGTNDLLRQEVELLDRACAQAGAEVENISAEVENISAENLRLYHDKKVLHRKLDETVALMDESATAMDDARQRIGELEAWGRQAVEVLRLTRSRGCFDSHTYDKTQDLLDSPPSPAGAVCPACGGVGNVSAVDADGRKWAPLCSTCNGKGSLDPSPAGASHGGSEGAAVDGAG